MMTGLVSLLCRFNIPAGFQRVRTKVCQFINYTLTSLCDTLRLVIPYAANVLRQSANPFKAKGVDSSAVSSLPVKEQLKLATMCQVNTYVM